MRPRSFFKSLLVAAALFALLNVVVAFVSRNSIPRQIARNIETTPGLNCVALGNSLMAAGFDAPTYESLMNRHHDRKTVAVNAGLGSSYPVEHLLLYRRALKTRNTLECAMYGFFDMQLMEPPQTAIQDVYGNRAMLYYFEPNVAAHYYKWSLWDLMGFHAARMLPVLAERGTIWARVERVRRTFGGLGMPKEESNHFGRVSDFSIIEPATPAELARQCDQAIETHRDLSEPILEMIRLSRERNIRLVMIEMPMSPTHVALFYNTPSWRRYRDYMRGLLSSRGVGYVVAGDWISEGEYFQDRLHLSGKGAIAFTRRLASESQL